MHASIPKAEAVSAACGVAGHALVEARLSEIPVLRDPPATPGVPTLPARFLRHCDEQTIVGMRAVLAAIAAHPEPRPSFTDYGVVAAPCQAGRIATAQSLAMLRTAGGVAVSPHIVPQCSLHSLAGAVSVALGMHGPNVGTSGGRQAVSEGLFTALSLLTAGSATAPSIPGVWLVLSGWTAEPALDMDGKPARGPAADSAAFDPVCRAVAVALTAAPEAAGTGRRLRLRMPTAVRIARQDDDADGSAGAADEILAFARALAAGDDGSWSHLCPWGADIQLGSGVAAAGAAPAAPRGQSLREAA